MYSIPGCWHTYDLKPLHIEALGITSDLQKGAIKQLKRIYALKAYKHDFFYFKNLIVSSSIEIFSSQKLKLKTSYMLRLQLIF